MAKAKTPRKPRTQALLNTSDFVLKEPIKFTRKRKIASLQERLAKNIDSTTTPDGCHPWTRDMSKNGYPSLGIKDPVTGKWVTKRAARVMMELKLGRPLRPDEHVLHGPGCARSCMKHLRVGTHHENMQDMIADKKSGRPRLSITRVKEIADRLCRSVAGGEKLIHTVDDISTELGIAQQSVYRIWQGKTFLKHTDMRRRRRAALVAKRKFKRSRMRVSEVIAAAHSLGQI